MTFSTPIIGAVILAMLLGIPAVAMAGDDGLKLLFMEVSDLHDTYGLLEFRASGFQYVTWVSLGTPRPIIRYAEPTETSPWGKGWWLYGVRSSNVGAQVHWEIVRYFTDDGRTLRGPIVLYEETSSGWIGEYEIVRNAESGEMLLLATRSEPDCLAKLAYGSSDGLSWRRLQDEPVYCDHDAKGLTWNASLHRYVVYQTTYQRWRKHQPDNIQQDVRRVLSIRTSVDGLSWNPVDKVGKWQSGPFLSSDQLITPDELDPPDAEFYRMLPFWYVDRWIALVLLYAPCPTTANPVTYTQWPGHGTWLYAEWWTSGDGLTWERPYRRQDALGEAPNIPFHNPIVTERLIRFIYSNDLYQIPIDRIAGVYSPSNAEFSTPVFVMPSGPLLLNFDASHRELPSPVGWGSERQSYVMLELRDEKNQVIPGYEKERAIYVNMNATDLKIEWDGKDGTDLAGQPVIARIYFRDATVYSLYADPR